MAPCGCSAVTLLCVLWPIFVDASSVLWYEDVLQLANESREVAAPARRYCDGFPTIDDDLLYETQVCTSSTTQTPLLDASTVGMELVELRNLSFCCKSNYTSVLPIGTNVTEKDEEARFIYNQAIEGALLRYDCASFYPFRTCAPCAYAYRSWVCSLVFPLGCRVDGSQDGTTSQFQAMPICRDVCLEVVRKCPIVFRSRCPTATTQYRDPGAPDAFANGTSFGAGGCNPMEHPHFTGGGEVFISAALGRTVSLVVAAGLILSLTIAL